MPPTIKLNDVQVSEEVIDTQLNLMKQTPPPKKESGKDGFDFKNQTFQIIKDGHLQDRNSRFAA